MRRDTALTIASILVAGGIVLGPTIADYRANHRAQVTDPIYTTPVDPAVFNTRTVPLRRVSDDARRDFCSMRQLSGGKCVPAEIRCPTGWKKVCQGTCACGGTICQCVKEEKANENNTCGNGICEPGEYRTELPPCDLRSSDCVQAPRLIPICQKDCNSLARSGTQESMCYDTRYADCARGVTDRNRLKDCEILAERFCGSNGQNPTCTEAQLKRCIDQLLVRNTSAIDAQRICNADCNGTFVAPPGSTCTNDQVKICVKRLMERGTSATDAERQCLADCAPPPALPPPPAPVGGCTGEEYAQCVERVILQGTRLSDAQDLCKKICNDIQGDRTYLDQLKKRVSVCDFSSIGRCCEVAKQLGNDAEKDCLTLCERKGVSIQDKALCN